MRRRRAEAAGGRSSQDGAGQGKPGSVAGRIRQVLGQALVYGFMSVGVLLSALLALGLVADGLSFDRTSGGYEPPYMDFTGAPIDWEAGHVTEEGFFKDGYVVDLYVDCATGMVSFEVFQQRWDWRKLSERALVVHEPAAACERAGFRPRF